MNYWFECKVAYDKTSDIGETKRNAEVYLVDALSFTEAEARIIEEIKPFVSLGELEVFNIKRVKISEMILNHRDEADKYYRAKVNFISYDEKNNVEKKTAATMIVKAEDLATAVSELRSELDKQLGVYEIAAISETLIMDIFAYEAPAK